MAVVIGRRASSPDSRLRIIEAWTTGYPSQNVVGESRYVRGLKKLAKRLGGGPTGEAMTTAVLLAEPFNVYDANAVAVAIDGDTVGYLPREDAVNYSAVLQDLSRRGVAISVPARVWWSQADGGDWMASVRLDLGPPGLLVPVNAPPTGDAMQLPPGTSMQVTGEDAHLDVLAPLVAGRGQVAVLASLHEVTEQKARSSKQVIEVRIDGRPAGRLTPAMSDHLLAVTRQAEHVGVVLFTRASVRGNALKAEVAIYPTKAADLPQTWIDDLTSRSTLAGNRPTAASAAVDHGSRREATTHPPAALPPAGWYANPTGPGLRWWDGKTWTEHTHQQ